LNFYHNVTIYFAFY